MMRKPVILVLLSIAIVIVLSIAIASRYDREQAALEIQGKYGLTLSAIGVDAHEEAISNYQAYGRGKIRVMHFTRSLTSSEYSDIFAVIEPANKYVWMNCLPNVQSLMDNGGGQSFGASLWITEYNERLLHEIADVKGLNDVVMTGKWIDDKTIESASIPDGIDSLRISDSYVSCDAWDKFKTMHSQVRLLIDKCW